MPICSPRSYVTWAKSWVATKEKRRVVRSLLEFWRWYSNCLPQKAELQSAKWSETRRTTGDDGVAWFDLIAQLIESERLTTVQWAMCLIQGQETAKRPRSQHICMKFGILTDYQQKPRTLMCTLILKFQGLENPAFFRRHSRAFSKCRIQFGKFKKLWSNGAKSVDKNSKGLVFDWTNANKPSGVTHVRWKGWENIQWKYEQDIQSYAKRYQHIISRYK